MTIAPGEPRWHLPTRLRAIWRSLDFVPVFATTDLVLGTAYLLAPRSRTLGPALATAREVLPIWAWGAMIFAVGFAAVVAIGHHKPPVYAMSAGAGWYVVFAGGTIWSALHDTTAGVGGSVLFTSLAVCHLLAARQR